MGSLTEFILMLSSGGNRRVTSTRLTTDELHQIPNCGGGIDNHLMMVPFEFFSGNLTPFFKKPQIFSYNFKFLIFGRE